MKLHLDVLPALRESAEKAINDHFNRLAYEAGQRDAEHAAKRAEARRLKQLWAEGWQGEPPQWFADAARIEGVGARAFADAVLAKPDEAAARGITRRRAIVTVRRAQDAHTIESVLAVEGITGV